MILTSTNEPVARTPPWREGDSDAPVFWLRAGTIIERGLMEAELSGVYNAAAPSRYELFEAAIAGLRILLEGDPELDALIELINAEAQGEYANLSPADQAKLQNVREIIAEHYPPYRALIAQGRRRVELAPIIALKRFCTGIDAKDVVFKRGKDGMVSDETLTGLTPLEISWAGSEAFAMQFGGGQEKNSAPPSTSDESLSPSSEDDSSRAAGKSAKTAGKKTRG